MNDSAKKVLIVDDDRFLLDMYTLKFKTAGFEVFSCNSGESAIQKLKEGVTPDIILMDIVMPGMDGFQTLEAMKKDKIAESAKVVMLTNQGKEENIDRAKSIGAVGYIVKASSVPSEVLAEVRRILGE